MRAIPHDVIHVWRPAEVDADNNLINNTDITSEVCTNVKASRVLWVMAVGFFSIGTFGGIVRFTDHKVYRCSAFLSQKKNHGFFFLCSVFGFFLSYLRTATTARALSTILYSFVVMLNSVLIDDVVVYVRTVSMRNACCRNTFQFLQRRL